MTACFLPWRGELGLMLLSWVRYVNSHPADNKIVCATRGSEALYPTATSFFYKWDEVQDQDKNGKLLRSIQNSDYLDSIKSYLIQYFPTAEFIYPDRHRENKREWNFKPEPRVKRGLTADIVLGPRFRLHGAGRNFEHWHDLTRTFTSWGLSVGLIGAADTSLDIHEDAIRSWDYDFMDAGLELLCNAKLAVMSCSGTAHLAVLCGTPLKVIYDEPGRAVDGNGPWYMEAMQKFATAHCEPIIHAWNDPEKIYQAVRQYLEIK